MASVTPGVALTALSPRVEPPARGPSRSRCRSPVPPNARSNRAANRNARASPPPHPAIGGDPPAATPAARPRSAANAYGEPGSGHPAPTRARNAPAVSSDPEDHPERSGDRGRSTICRCSSNAPHAHPTVVCMKIRRPVSRLHPGRPRRRGNVHPTVPVHRDEARPRVADPELMYAHVATSTCHGPSRATATASHTAA